MKGSYKSGQLILEVVVAIGISAMVLVSLLAVVNRGIRNTDTAMLRSNAASYAKEGVEVVRKTRDRDGWVAFRSLYDGDRELPGNNNLQIGSCSAPNVPVTDSIFTRCVNFVQDGSPVDKVTVTVTVSWADRCPGGDCSVEAKTYLTKWGK